MITWYYRHGHSEGFCTESVDVYSGSSGSQWIWAWGGNDTIAGGDGSDSIHGGNGNDKLWGQNDDDLVTGGNGNDHVDGGYGNDRLYGDNGNDNLQGDGGDDTLYGGNGQDSLYGASGNDRLYGDGGNDSLHGAEGNDSLYGGAGIDRLRGGDGKDRFVFDDGDSGVGSGNRDSVEDFQRGEYLPVNGQPQWVAGDIVDLSAIDANTQVSGDQAFTYVGTLPFSGAAQIRCETIDGAKVLSLNLDSDAAAEMQIQLSTGLVPFAADFLL